jgi:hypothetical protein
MVEIEELGERDPLLGMTEEEQWNIINQVCTFL